MSLAIKYESVDDARMRLRNTVVLYKGAPVLITNIAHGEDKGEILRVMIQPLPFNAGEAVYDPFERAIAKGGPKPVMAEEEKRKYISSKHFDIAPFRMGYVNSNGGAFYCSRLPNRVQKQGLCTENFKGFTNSKQNVHFSTFLNSKEVPAMVAGNYPSFERAVAGLEKTPSVAFDRDFCVLKDEVIPELIYLYHKGVKVGYLAKNEVALGRKFNCLKENLEELRVKVGAM